MKPRNRSVLLLIAALSPACTKDLTQLIAVVDSDLAVPAELRAIDVTVTSGSETLGTQSFTLTRLPVSFGVAPKDQAQVVITVKALGSVASSTAPPLFSVVVRTRAIDGKVLRVPIFLAAACLTAASSCAPADIDPATLKEVVPGRELDELPPRPDAGVVEDTGIQPDAEEPDAGPQDAGPAEAGPTDSCTRTSECPADHVCLDLKEEGSAVCPAGVTTCQCYRTCDALSNMPQPCGAGLECFWWQRPTGRGAACVPEGPGGRQNDTCRATFDVSGNKLDDDCDPYANMLCIFPTPSNPSGSCARYCDVRAAQDLCAGLGSFACNDTYAQPGLCLNRPPAAQDIGQLCTMPSECTTQCSMAVGYCTASCALDLDVCADGTNCINLPQPEGWTCLKACQGDPDCPSADYYCESFGTLRTCVPKCTATMKVCPSGRTNCDLATGRCKA